MNEISCVSYTTAYSIVIGCFSLSDWWLANCMCSF